MAYEEGCTMSKEAGMSFNGSRRRVYNVERLSGWTLMGNECTMSKDGTLKTLHKAQCF